MSGNRSGWGTTWIVALVMASGCGTAGPLKDPKSPAYEPKNTARCHISASQTKPLIVEWRPEDRGALETQARHGLIAVRYDGCEMEVLAGCNAPVPYRYASMTPKKTTETIRNEDELYAAVPLGAARLEGKLRTFGELNVKMTLVGRWEAERRNVNQAELRGNCARATHVIAGMTVGAFSFYAGATSEDGAGATVMGLAAGGKGARARENLAEDGDPSKCETATDKDSAPVTNCAAIIRLEVTELGSTTQGCAPGTTLRGTECVPTVAAPERPQSPQFAPVADSTPAPAMAPAPPPMDPKRLAALAQRSITSDDALQLLRLTHPTGRNGTLGTVTVSQDDANVIVDIPVHWAGGFTATPYRTVFRWRLDRDGGSTLFIASDSASIPIVEPARLMADQFLKAKRASLGR